MEAYLAELSLTGRSPRTVELYALLLGKLSKRLGPGHAIATVSRAEVMAHLGTLANDGLATNYMALNAKALKYFFRWAHAQGEIREDLLRGIKIVSSPDSPVPPFTDDELGRLMAAAQSPIRRAVLLLLMDTGMRASELTGLRLADVDLAAGQIICRGKGGKVRILALNPEPRKALEAYLASKAQLDGLLWPEGWTRRNLTNMVDSIARKAKVARCYPHRFRHTWAIQMRRAGVDVLALQQLLGHSNVQQTLHYIRWVEQEHAVEIHRQHSVVRAA